MKLEEYREFLWKEIDVTMDRPMGSKHPKHWFIYPLNYGFVPWSLAWDGEEVDVFVVWVFEPLQIFKWICIAYINRKDDNEAKLVVAPNWKMYTKDQIYALVEFQEQWFDSEVVVM